MNLSKNFTLKELCHSNTANRLGIDNSVKSQTAIANLQRLSNKVLQPLRDEFGPFTVSSGYRGLELNRYLGSQDTSQHVLGQAVDIKSSKFKNKKLSNLDIALWLFNNVEFDQLILEKLKTHKDHAGWIHVSYADEESNRKELLEFNGRFYQKILTPRA